MPENLTIIAEGRVEFSDPQLQDINPLDAQIFDSVKRVYEYAGAINGIVKSRDTKQSKILLDVAIRLKEMNMALMSIDITGQHVDRLFESIMKAPVKEAGDEYDPDNFIDFHRSNKGLKDQQYPLAGRSRFSGETQGLWNTEVLQELWNKPRSAESFNKRHKAVMSLVDKVGPTVGAIKGLMRKLEGNKKRNDIGRYVETLKKISVPQQKFESAFFEIYIEYMATQAEITDEEGAPTTRDPSSSLHEIEVDLEDLTSTEPRHFVTVVWRDGSEQVYKNQAVQRANEIAQDKSTNVAVYDGGDVIGATKRAKI